MLIFKFGSYRVEKDGSTWYKVKKHRSSKCIARFLFKEEAENHARKMSELNDAIGK